MASLTLALVLASFIFFFPEGVVDSYHKQSMEKQVRGKTEGLFTGIMREVSGAGA